MTDVWIERNGCSTLKREGSAISCLHCGMQVSRGTVQCPKCDNRLDRQTDGSTVTVDIAHHGERVHEALLKLDTVLDEVQAGVSARIRLIVGGGLIRDAVLARLADEQRRGVIRGFSSQSDNAGVVVVQVR